MKYDIDALNELHKDEIRELKELEDELIDEPLDPFWEAFFDEARIISVVGQPDFKNLPLKELHRLKTRKRNMRELVIARLAEIEIMRRERERFREMFGN